MQKQMKGRWLVVRKDALPRGFSTPPSFHSHMLWPDGVKETLQLVIDHTYGRRSVCQLTIKEIARLRGKCRQTVSVHLAFLEDRKQIRFQYIKRGDGRSRQIVLCVREKGQDIRAAIERQIEELPERALKACTVKGFREERRRGKLARKSPKVAKETRSEYVA